MSRNVIYMVLLVVALGVLAGTFLLSREQSLTKAKVQLQTKQAAKMQALAEAEKEKARAEAEKAKKEKAKADQAKAEADQAKADAEKAEAEAEERVQKEQTKQVEEKARLARAEADKAAREKETAALKAQEAETYLAAVEVTNETHRIELAKAEEARKMVALDLERKQVLLKTEELKKADYEALLRETKKLTDILRQREEESRPDRTMTALIEENERQREAELEEAAAKADAAALAELNARRERYKKGVAAPKLPPKTDADRYMDSARVAQDELWASEQAKVEATLRVRFEKAIRAATAAGDTEAATYLAENAARLLGKPKVK